MDEEESKEFETLLLHLGQDIGYMGLRVQKDVQKYIKDLKTTHDCKKFCSKLAVALKRFSTYTGQYAKDLEARINKFNKEDEYEEVKSTLKTIICTNGLGPPNNNSGDEPKELISNDVKNEVLSQCSLHIGVENDLKNEPLTQLQSLTNENQDVSHNDLDLPNTELHANQDHSQESSATIIYTPSSPSENVDSRNNVLEEGNDGNGRDPIENDDDFANSLEISHSEDVLSNEDQGELDVEIPVVDSSTDVQPTHDGLNSTPSNTDAIPKAIPLPYQPLHKKPNDNEQSENDSNQQKMKAIPLPYKPLFEKETTLDEAAQSSNIEDNIDKENEGNDSDVEIISVPSSPEKDDQKPTRSNYRVDAVAKKEKSRSSIDESNDSDVEIIDGTPPLENISTPESIVESPEQPRGNDDCDVASVARNSVSCLEIPPGSDSDVNHSSEETVASSNSAESQDVSENIEFDAEPRRTSNEEIFANAKLPDSEGSNESEMETMPSNSQPNGEDSPDRENIPNVAPETIEKTPEKGGSDTETVANTPSRAPNDTSLRKRDSDHDSEATVANTSLSVGDASTLGDKDSDRSSEVASPQNSEATVANVDDKGGENDSDATIISSPLDQGDKDGSDEGRGSDDDDSIYSKPTQKSVDDTQKFNVADNSNDDFDLPTQLVLHERSESKDNSSDNNSLIGLEGSQAGDGAEEEADMDMATQDMLSSDIPQDKPVTGAEDTTAENIEPDMASQESIVFDMENDQENTEASSISPMASAEGSIASPKNNDENTPKGEDAKDGDTMSVSEFSSCASDATGDISETDARNKEIKRSKFKKKIKDKDRKSLLKVIAEYYLKRKTEKAKSEKKNDTEKCDNNDGSKENSKEEDSNKERYKKSTATPKKSEKTKRLEGDNSSSTDDKAEKKKRKSGIKKGDKEAKKYIDFLNFSKIDESSKSSDEFAKDNMDIQEDSSDESDIDATQIETFDTAKDKDVQQGSPEEIKRRKSTGGDKTDNTGTDDSEGFFLSSNEMPNSSESKESIQTFSEYINQLPSPASKSHKNEHIGESPGSSEEDSDLTQKVEDISKLKHLSAEEISGNMKKQLPKDNEDQQMQEEHENEEDDKNAEPASQVVNPFKKKAVLPLADSSSEDEDTSQVVTPFKKNRVKRLHSSGESDCEPPRKASEIRDTNESDAEIAKPFKRTSLKRLSTDVESEASQGTTAIDDPVIKRRKIESTSISERDNSQIPLSDMNVVEEMDGDQNDGEIVEEEVVYNFEPSQFTLDDNARDDFLEMLTERTGTDNNSFHGDREENVNVEPSQFKLGDCDRDNLLNLLTDKENDKTSEDVELGETEKSKSAIVLKVNDKKSDDNEIQPQEIANNISVKKENYEDIDMAIEPSQFKLDNSARDELLDLFNNGEGSSDKQDVEKEDVEHGSIEQASDSSVNNEEGSSDKQDAENGSVEQASDSSEKDDFSKANSVETDENDFQLNKEARDAFYDLLNNKQSDESEGDENGEDEGDAGNIEPSQFKLNSKDRDEFLDLLGGDSDSDEKGNNFKENKEPSGSNSKNDEKSTDALHEIVNCGDPRSSNDKNKKLIEDNETEQPLSTAKHRDSDSEKNDDENGDDGEAQGVSSNKQNLKDDEAEVGDKDDDDDAVTENSQGIDDDMGDLDDGSTVPGGIPDEKDKNKEKTTTKSSEYKLDANERDELLEMLRDHINRNEGSSGSDSSDSEVGTNKESDSEKDKGGPSKRRRKLKNIDSATLLELLEEYENAVAGKEEKLIANVKKGDKEHGRVGMESATFSDSNNSEDSGGDSDSILLDLLREEAVDQAADGQKKTKAGKPRNTSKEAWDAYQLLLKDNDDLSDSSSELSNIDIDNLELDFSDQERRQKQKNRHDNLRKRFGIDKELFVDIVEADITGYDVPATTKETKGGSKIDRLCDISNVLQKRNPLPRKKRYRRKRRRLPSESSWVASNSDSDSESSSATNWSDISRRTRRSSASSRDSLLQQFSDHEQAKLASALWDNIKNSSDENEGWSSSGGSGSSSSDEEEENKKRKKDSSVGGRRKKKKKESGSEKEEKEESEEESGSEKSVVDGDGSASGSGNEKEADLDSSDEDDFVGVRKNRGAWKSDPLLRSCFTSDEDSDSDAEQKKKPRTKKKARPLVLGSDSSGTSSDDDFVGEKTPNKKTDLSDSDVELVLTKSPKKKVSVSKDVEADEDDSPSKRGKGRRNIRALVEDDELADATKQAKKKENERIKRLQEREKAMESFTQSQSFGSQLTEDDENPLILDANEEVLIKVHPKISNKLKPHQRSGIQFMWDSCYESVAQLKEGYEGSGCILAHCMGLGKTLQALGLIHTVFTYEVTQTKHVLVVCPLSTVANWRNEWKLAFKQIKRFKAELYTIQDKKGASNRFQIVNRWWRNGGVLIMGYECFGILTNEQKLDKWEQQGVGNKKDALKALVNPGPDLVICDEGHLLRNKQSQRTLALNKVNTKRRIVLTGTPLQNNLLEYYYMVNFVKPSLLGTQKEFKTNFVNPIENGQFENSTATDILFMKKRTHVLHKILAKTVQRVEDTELKQYLPALVDQALFVKLSDLQVKFYNTFLDHANSRPTEYTASGNVSRKNFLADTQILRYICTHPDIVTIAKSTGKSKIKEQDVIDDDDDAIEDKVITKAEWFKDLVPDSGVKEAELGTKMMVALAIVEEAVANNDKVLIFSQTHAEMDSLEYFLRQKFKYKKGFDYNRMDGTISPEVRTYMCDKFNDKKNKRLRVFIMSTKVGGLGLNLTAANRVILMNVNWNPSYDTQSVFRAFRFGQDKAVYVYRLIAMNTMEEKVYQRQVTKLAVAHRVVDKHQITRHYSAADIQEFYSARPTTEGIRPLPNVPDDRILAKLIQKYQFVFKWHEHQALLANRPEEDLNEQQKNAAWEEFNKKAVEPPPLFPGVPPPQLMTASDLLNRPSTSTMNYGRVQYQPGSINSAGGLYADHNYSLPKTNPTIAQRTTSADDFRSTTQAKYVPRPIFVDVTAPLGPRPNLGGVNPLAAKKNQPTVNKTVQNQPANAATKPVQNSTTNTTPTQVRLGGSITLTPSNGQKNPPPAHNQKPSMSIIPHKAASRSMATNTTKPPPFVPKHINMVQNPLNLIKNVQQPGQTQPNTAKNVPQVTVNQLNLAKNIPQLSQNQPNRGAVQSQREKPPNQNTNTFKKTSTVVHMAGTSAQVSKNPATVQAPTERVNAPHQKIVTKPPLRQPPPRTTVPPLMIRPVPPSSLLTTPITTTSDPLHIPPSPNTSTASTQQSPLQKQMRQFMEHLHRLQNTLQNDQDVVGTSNPSGGAWNASRGNQGTQSNTTTTVGSTFGPNNKVSGAPITLNSLCAPTVVKVGPKPLSPVVGGMKPTNLTGLNAARNLSNITQKYHYQRGPNNKQVGVLLPPATSASHSSPPQTTANGQRVVVVSPNSFGNTPRTYGKGISSKADGKTLKINPVGQAKGTDRRVITKVGSPNAGISSNNGQRVVANVVSTTAPAAVARMMPVGRNVARLVPVSPGAKKLVVSQKTGARQNGGFVQNQKSPVRVVTAPPTATELQQKMAANLSNLTRIPPKKLPPAPQRSFNNGTSIKTYQAKKNSAPSRSTSLPSLSINPSTSASKSNKENRNKRRLSVRANNNAVTSSIDLSKDEDSGSTSSGSLSQDMVNTLKKKGVSINYLGKDVINLD